MKYVVDWATSKRLAFPLKPVFYVSSDRHNALIASKKTCHNVSEYVCAHVSANRGFIDMI